MMRKNVIGAYKNELSYFVKWRKLRTSWMFFLKMIFFQVLFLNWCESWGSTMLVALECHSCRRSITQMPKSALQHNFRLVIWTPPGRNSTMSDFSASRSHLGPWVTLHKTTAGQSVKAKVPMECRNRTDVYSMTAMLRLFLQVPAVKTYRVPCSEVSQY